MENCGVLPLNVEYSIGNFLQQNNFNSEILSAITVSFSSEQLNLLNIFVNFLSEVFPGQLSDTSDITPIGVIPTKKNYGCMVFLIR